MNTKKITLMLCFMLAVLFVNTSFKAQKKTSDEITASINCKSLGTLNGVVTYQYDVTLKNNTSDKLKVEYKVNFKNGDVIKKQHSHSTILIPSEELTESNENSMSESDWNSVSGCQVEWTASKL